MCPAMRNSQPARFIKIASVCTSVPWGHYCVRIWSWKGRSGLLLSLPSYGFQLRVNLGASTSPLRQRARLPSYGVGVEEDDPIVHGPSISCLVCCYCSLDIGGQFRLLPNCSSYVIEDRQAWGDCVECAPVHGSLDVGACRGRGTHPGSLCLL
jgi:hypothetical protein